MITVYTLTYNEELLIQFMIDHYRSRFPDCPIIIYDNMSTDNTAQIANSNDCTVIPFDTDDEYREARQMEIRNNCWKEAQTDWVLICDLDELLDIDVEALKIEERNGTSIIRTETYDMINLKNNLNIAGMKYAVKSPIPGKFCLFSKKCLKEINYSPGSHTCNPEGKINYSKGTYKLYHYNSINPDITVKKFKERAVRMSSENLENGWGIHYLMTAEEIIEEYKIERKKAVQIR